MAAKRSIVWEYFKQVFEKDKPPRVRCTLCEDLTLAYSGGTGNMLHHLEKKHPLSMKRKSSSDGKKQQTLASFKSCSTERSTQITKSIAMFVAMDLRPIAVVDGHGFKALLKVLEPGYTVASRPHLTATCRREYNLLKEHIMAALQLRYHSFTTDIWTSRATQAYITLTCHWIDDDWKLNSKVLFTSEMSERHTGINIADRLKQGCLDWRIPEDHIVSIVHDNASNMTNAIASLTWESTPCVAHTLQLAVTKGLEVSEISRLTAVCRKLVGHFKHSVRASEALKDKQKQLNIKEHHLIQDVSTRWNSVYFMLERLQEQQWSLYAVLHDRQVTEDKYKNLYLKDDQWALLTQMVTTLKPLQIATTALCEAEIISVSLVYPIITSLINKHLVINGEDLAAVKKCKDTVRNGVLSRFTPTNMAITRKVPVLAFSLDCRYHKLQFLSSEQRAAVYEILKKKCDELREVNNGTITTSEDLGDESEPPTKKKKETALNFLLGEDEIVGRDSSESEVDRFLDEMQLPSDTNVLDWWRVNSSKYPLLALLAKQYLTSPATSVPSERIFSAAGLTVNQQRASLNPDNVDNYVNFFTKEYV